MSTMKCLAPAYPHSSRAVGDAVLRYSDISNLDQAAETESRQSFVSI